MPNSPCEFWLREVHFFGYIVNQDGILVDPNKIKAIMQWEVPRSPYDIQCFLRLASYYSRFIQVFSKIIVPLTHLRNKSVMYQRGSEHQTTFNTLRQMLCYTLVLTLADGVDDFVVYCYALITSLDMVSDIKNQYTKFSDIHY